MLAPWAGSAPGVSVERITLDEHSWIDVARGWLAGADEVYTAVRDHTRWEQPMSRRYERVVPEPRLSAVWKPGRPMAHPAVAEAHAELQQRYRVPFETIGLTWFRDGRDSHPFDRATDLRWLDQTVVAVLSLGASRQFLIRRRGPVADGEVGLLDLRPASGDLVVMGGRCQRDWEHAVPKGFGITEGRIALQWRWTARTGRPDVLPG